LNPEEQLGGIVAALASVGLSCLIMGGHALKRTANPITQAFLFPWLPEAVAATPVVEIESVVDRKVRSVAPASSLHRSLVEVVRRQYKVFCQDRDRADKEAISLTPSREQGTRRLAF
jgi:hypothetical protein